MLRTSIAAVVHGCFYFFSLDCEASVIVVDCAAVETGRMLDKCFETHVGCTPASNATTKGDIDVPGACAEPIFFSFSV